MDAEKPLILRTQQDNSYFKYSHNGKLPFPDNYFDYVDNGGDLIIFMDSPEKTNSSANDFLGRFDMQYTDNGIDNSGSAVAISNFTDSYLFEGVVSIDFEGGEVISTDQNTTELGWFRSLINGPFSTVITYYSIGAESHLLNCSVTIFGSSFLINNQNLDDLYSINFDRVIANYLDSL